jgi:SSS family transporter
VISSEKVLYVIGGRTADGLSDSVFSLTLEEGQLVREEIIDLPTSLNHLTATLDESNLYVAGYTVEEESQKELIQLDLDNLTGGWTELDVWPGSTRGNLVAAYQDKNLYVGEADSDGTSMALYRYDDIDGWSSRESLPSTFHNGGVSLSLGPSHILFGGIDATRANKSRLVLWTFHTVTNTWSEIGGLELSDGIGPVIPWFIKKKAPEIDLSGLVMMGGTGELTGSSSVVLAEIKVKRGLFTWLDYTAVVVYLVGMILMGLYFSRRETGTEDFSMGGRKMPWWAVGFSLYATGTSAISFMAIPAISFGTNWIVLSQNVFSLFATVFVAIYLVPLIRRLNITSTFEYLESRFHPSIRMVGSFQCLIYQICGRMSIVLFLPALALSSVTGIDVVTSILVMGVIATVYTVLGGIKAVIWTDVVQVIVLLGGAVFCLFVIIKGIDGGLSEFFRIAAADDKTRMFDWSWNYTIPTAWTFLLLVVLNVTELPRDQVMVQRILSTKGDKEAGKSVFTLALIVIPGSVLFFGLGTALYAFYKSHPDRLSPLLSGVDSTLPYFVAAELPIGITGLIIAALFAASMSSLDSSMNSVATVITVDFYKRFKKNVTDQASLRLAKWITIFAGIFGTVFALIISRYSFPYLFEAFAGAAGLLGGGMGGVYSLGLFTRRANWQGAMIGMGASVLATWAAQHYTDMTPFLFVGVAIVSCVVIGYLSSLCFPAPSQSLKGLTLFKVK